MNLKTTQYLFIQLIVFVQKVLNLLLNKPRLIEKKTKTFLAEKEIQNNVLVLKFSLLYNERIKFADH